MVNLVSRYAAMVARMELPANRLSTTENALQTLSQRRFQSTQTEHSQASLDTRVSRNSNNRSWFGAFAIFGLGAFTGAVIANTIASLDNDLDDSGKIQMLHEKLGVDIIYGDLPRTKFDTFRLWKCGCTDFTQYAVLAATHRKWDIVKYFLDSEYVSFRVQCCLDKEGSLILEKSGPDDYQNFKVVFGPKGHYDQYPNENWRYIKRVIEGGAKVTTCFM